MSQQINLFEEKIPSMPKLDVSRCYSKPINYQTAKRIVETYHYARRTPSIMLAVGMYVDEILAGVITYGMMASPNAQAAPMGKDYAENTIELNRLFVFDWAGMNSESWLIGQSFKWLQEKLSDRFILVSYADKGENHIEYIYQATNWHYTGLSIPGGNPTEMFVDGIRMTTKNAYDKFGSQGIAELEEMGHTVVKPKDKRTEKHRYVYFLGSKRHRKAMKKKLKWPILDYPKAIAPPPAKERLDKGVRE